MSETGDPGVRRAQSGETLIEALVVVAITTMVALIGFPRLQQGLLTLSQRQAAAVVAARLRQARADALTSDKPVVFQVSVDGRTFAVSNGRTAAPPPGVTVEMTTGGSRIAFYGDGSSSGGRILVKAARRVVPISVMPDTGVVIMGGM